MSILIGVVIALAVIVNVGGVAGMVLQRKARVNGPTEHKSYRVEVGPSGVPWIAAFNWDGGWLFAPYYWWRYLRHRPRTWSVVAFETPTGRESFREVTATRRQALQIYDQAITMIEQGQHIASS